MAILLTLNQYCPYYSTSSFSVEPSLGIAGICGDLFESHKRTSGTIPEVPGMAALWID
jgi:hypothetical protein